MDPLVPVVPSAHRDLEVFSSKSSVHGEVLSVRREIVKTPHGSLTAQLLSELPRGKVVRDGDASDMQSGDVASDAAEMASVTSTFADTAAHCTVLVVGKRNTATPGAPVPPANVFTVVVTRDWEESCSFVSVGDELSVNRFDVLPLEFANQIGGVPQGALLMMPNYGTEIAVIRKRRIVINHANAGQLQLLELTDRERKALASVKRSAALGQGEHAPAPTIASLETPAPTDTNTFAKAQRYVDVIFGQKDEHNKIVDFVVRTLGSSTERTVLDVGCGTGLLGFSLRYCGVFPSLMDKSAVMGDIVKEKNAFVSEVEGENSTGKGRTLPFYHADVRNFALLRINADGQELHQDFSLVLCLDTLALLDSPEEVQRALHNLHLHTTLGGTCIVSFPDKQAAMNRRFTQSTLHLPIDKYSLCVGATTGLQTGQLDLIIRTKVEEPSAADLLQAYHDVSDDDNDDEEGPEYEFDEGESMGSVPRRTTTYVGAALHRHGLTRQSQFVDFTDATTELLMSGGLLETMMLEAGFDIEELFGSLAGTEFVPGESQKRVYVLKKRTAV